MSEFHTLNLDQLYRLNDGITSALMSVGWIAQDDTDDEKLNDLVLDVANSFFPARKDDE